jgi:hypothetical protein
MAVFVWEKEEAVERMRDGMLSRFSRGGFLLLHPGFEPSSVGSIVGSIFPMARGEVNATHHWQEPVLHM